MELNPDYIEGQTPLNEEEMQGLLIPTITTRAELDEFEQLNIEKAVIWTLQKKFSANEIFTIDFVQKLHQRMFGDVWNWAGEFRKSNKNLGVEWHQVETELRKLLDDAVYWLNNNSYPADEIAIRFKHRIVSIHCFSNGNGRHSRLIADVIAINIFGSKEFSWGGANLNSKGDVRKSYLAALRKADANDTSALIKFARS